MEEIGNTSKMDIGRRIAKRRSQMGLTQEKAAELSGLSHQFFACVERGLKSIRAESIIKLSLAMNINTDYILLGKSTDEDRSYLAQMLRPLNEVQLKCMEEIIKNYLIACGYGENDESDEK